MLLLCYCLRTNYHLLNTTPLLLSQDHVAAMFKLLPLKFCLDHVTRRCDQLLSCTGILTMLRTYLPDPISINLYRRNYYRWSMKIFIVIMWCRKTYKDYSNFQPQLNQELWFNECLSSIHTTFASLQDMLMYERRGTYSAAESWKLMNFYNNKTKVIEEKHCCQNTSGHDKKSLHSELWRAKNEVF